MTFPDHLVDVKRVLAWVRDHAADLGADPGFIAITGGSAGAHLAALAALTPNQPEYQPGFESADTTVQACVPFYGIYDFTNRAGRIGGDGMGGFLERVVMKRRIADSPDAFRLASPICLVRPDAPPFALVHGINDSFADIEDARAFASELRRTSRASDSRGAARCPARVRRVADPADSLRHRRRRAVPRRRAGGRPREPPHPPGMSTCRKPLVRPVRRCQRSQQETVWPRSQWRVS